MLIKAFSVNEEIKLEGVEHIEQADPECNTSSTNIDKVAKFVHEKKLYSISMINNSHWQCAWGRVLYVLFLIFTTKPILNYMGLHYNSPMLKPAQQYLTLRTFGAPVIILSMAMEGVFWGTNDTRTPLYATSASFLSLH